MQLLAIALAASLVIGPAPVDTEVEVPIEDQARLSLPDVDDPPEGEAEVEVVEAEATETEAETETEVETETKFETKVETEPTPDPPPPGLEAPAEQPPVTRDRLGCEQSKSCRRMTVAGIVVGTFGLAAVGTGIGLLVKRDEVIPESPTFVTSTRPAGVVIVTLGAGVTLTAVLMLVAAHRGYKQRERQAKAPPSKRAGQRVELIGNGLRF
ncbi:MAG: hypothetical protein R6X02_23960 [Enhygromyxa sp.]